MNRVALAVSLALASLSTASAQSGAEAAIRRSFDSYKSALLQRDGDASVNLVTSNTIAFYDECRQGALTMPRTELERSDIFRQLTILRFRVDFEAQRLRTMNGRQLFIWAVDQGLVGSNFADIEIASIQVSGNTAAVQARKPGAGSVTLSMKRERGTWRLDLMQLMEQSRTAVEQSFRAISSDRKQALMRILGMTTGRPPADSVWDPLVRPSKRR